jgi:hypothetical protein
MGSAGPIAESDAGRGLATRMEEREICHSSPGAKVSDWNNGVKQLWWIAGKLAGWMDWSFGLAAQQAFRDDPVCLQGGRGGGSKQEVEEGR